MLRVGDYVVTKLFYGILQTPEIDSVRGSEVHKGKAERN